MPAATATTPHLVRLGCRRGTLLIVHFCCDGTPFGHHIGVLEQVLVGEVVKADLLLAGKSMRGRHHSHPRLAEKCRCLQPGQSDRHTDVSALASPAGGIYAGVDDNQSPTMRQIAEAISVAAGHPGTASSITMEQARHEVGPLADAFALDQRVTAAHAHRVLGWTPAARDTLAQLATGGRAPSLIPHLGEGGR